MDKGARFRRIVHYAEMAWTLSNGQMIKGVLKKGTGIGKLMEGSG
jgi:hypothetical protein